MTLGMLNLLLLVSFLASFLFLMFSLFVAFLIAGVILLVFWNYFLRFRFRIAVVELHVVVLSPM